LFLKNAGIKVGFLSKLISSALFCLTGIIAAFSRGRLDIFAALMLIALAAAFAGDILLAAPAFLKDEYKGLFSAAGGAAFLFSHLLYIVVFLCAAPPILYLIPVAAVVPILYGCFIKAKLLSPKKNSVPIVAYGAVLGCLIFSASGLALNGLVLGYLALPAALLFVLSDTALFFYNFGHRPFAVSRTAVNYLILLPYYAAQALFAVAVFFLP
jgi:uncharacterized membrane protein YhhN